MIRHHRVQMPPVAMSAPLCISDSDSGGRAKSAMEAATRIHCYASALLPTRISCPNESVGTDGTDIPS
jgi:hypothetical protein